MEKGAAQDHRTPSAGSPNHSEVPAGVEVSALIETPSLAGEPGLPAPGAFLRGVQVVKAYRYGAAMVVVSCGSVVDFEGDAIVNAANAGCLGGGGVDGAVSSAGGPDMRREREALPILKGTRMNRCATGDAKMTTGGSLKARKCIHAVGPNYLMYRGRGKSLEDADELLASAYQRAVAVARDSGVVRSIAFALLSAGVFRGPRKLEEVLLIGVRALAGELAKSSGAAVLNEVHLMAFTGAEEDALLAVCDRIFTIFD